MDEFARLLPRERQEVFRAAALPRRGSIIIEKDFWVCWALQKIFSLGESHPKPIFKGGTSISKGYCVIDRFSEDIDIGVHRSWFSFDDAILRGSRNARARAIQQLIANVAAYARERFVPALNEIANRDIGIGNPFRIDAMDGSGQTVLFEYPVAIAGPPGYVEQMVRIDLGGRSDAEPHDTRTITSYVASEYPHLFTVPSIEVDLLDVKRTFWEKATILHSVAHLREDRALPIRYARHYYDVAKLALSEYGAAAIEATDILDAVARHKSHFFAETGAKSTDPYYALAAVGTLRLVPGTQRIAEIQADYEKMEEMFLVEPPTISGIVQELRELEDTINARMHV